MGLRFSYLLALAILILYLEDRAINELAFPKSMLAGENVDNTINLVGKVIHSLSWRSMYVRYFFVVMASLFIVFAVVGFGQTLHALYKERIPLHWLVHVHGALLTAWLFVFLSQSILAVRRKFKFHRQLGKISVSLGLLVLVSIAIVIFIAHIGYPFHANIAWGNVLLLSLTMALYGIFFTWGILARRNGPAHKRLLFFATLMLISAGFARVLLSAGVDGTIRWLPIPGIASPSLSGMPNPSGIIFYNDLLIIPLIIYDLIKLNRIHKITLIACSCVGVVHLSIIFFWKFFN